MTIKQCVRRGVN